MEGPTSAPISVLIADDEPLARDLLRGIVERQSGFIIVAEVGDGREALAALRLRAPDVAFLDVRMPYVDGIQAAKDAAGATVFVFVTAYDRHALQAFEAGGVDYLLKPLDPARVAKVFDRVRSEVRRRRLDVGGAEELADKVEDAVLRLRVGRDIRLVRCSDIVWIEAANQYANLHLRTGASILVSFSLGDLHRKLDASEFYRVHRSAVVNRAQVNAIRADAIGGLRLTMKGGAVVPVSRRFRRELSRLAPPELS